MELLIVIALLGILSMLIINLVRSASPQARDVKRKQQLEAIKNALEMYYADHESYPTTNATYTGNFPFNDKFQDAGKTYMQKVPEDPAGGTSMKYMYYSDGSGYTMYTCLEVTPTGSVPYSNKGCCENNHCYYGVSSTDRSP